MLFSSNLIGAVPLSSGSWLLLRVAIWSSLFVLFTKFMLAFNSGALFIIGLFWEVIMQRVAQSCSSTARKWCCIIVQLLCTVCAHLRKKYSFVCNIICSTPLVFKILYKGVLLHQYTIHGFLLPSGTWWPVVKNGSPIIQFLLQQ